MRDRNARECAAMTLPGLPSLDSVPGNPRYVINLLQMREEDEDLRATLWADIVGIDTLLFDSLDGCREFQLHCRQENKRHGTLLCIKEGVKVVDSVLCGQGKEHADLTPLKFKFGSVPAAETAKGRRLRRRIQMVRPCEQALASHEKEAKVVALKEQDESGKRSDLEQDIATQKAKIAELGAESDEEEGGGCHGASGGSGASTNRRTTNKGRKRKQMR
mmetsp:Transcript_67350/g.115681  ORF Transcript_67350/g.115681 Transcript_67350/m.115681 type:complete len:218 (+) Transcript_67350:65-718(+)